MENTDIGAMKVRLQDKGTNLIFFERSLGIDLDEVLSAVVALSEPLQVWFINEHVDDPEIRIAAAIRKCGGDPSQWSSITSDASDLYRAFVELTGDSQPFLSLRVVDASYLKKEQSSVSSEWHRDSAVLTMFTTYLGYGTQWTPDSNVRRDYFVDRQKQHAKDPDSVVLHDPALVMTTSLHGIGILKGELRLNDSDTGTADFLSNFASVDRDTSFNVGGGLIHRGPARVSADHRLLLTISTFIVPSFLSSALEAG